MIEFEELSKALNDAMLTGKSFLYVDSDGRILYITQEIALKALESVKHTIEASLPREQA